MIIYVLEDFKDVRKFSMFEYFYSDNKFAVKLIINFST